MNKLEKLINIKFVFNRKDGGRTLCFGKIEEDSNFEVICDNEAFDGIAADIDCTELNTWTKVCKHLEANYNPKVEEITTCQEKQ